MAEMNHTEIIQEIFRRCREEGVLVPFLASHEKEVSDILEESFTREDFLATLVEAKEAEAEGKGAEQS